MAARDLLESHHFTELSSSSPICATTCVTSTPKQRNLSARSKSNLLGEKEASVVNNAKEQGSSQNVDNDSRNLVLWTPSPKSTAVLSNHGAESLVLWTPSPGRTAALIDKDESLVAWSEDNESTLSQVPSSMNRSAALVDWSPSPDMLLSTPTQTIEKGCTNLPRLKPMKMNFSDCQDLPEICNTRSHKDITEPPQAESHLHLGEGILEKSENDTEEKGEKNNYIKVCLDPLKIQNNEVAATIPICHKFKIIAKASPEKGLLICALNTGRKLCNLNDKRCVSRVRV